MQVGKYSNGSQATSCETCQSPKTTKAEQSVSCDACEKSYYYINKSDGRCKRCPEGVDCESAKGNELETLWVKPGYFRATSQSNKIYPCTFGDMACQGGNRSGNELCFEGYEGPLCDMLVLGP